MLFKHNRINVLAKHPAISLAVLFGCSFFLFLSFQLIPNIPDPDSFYHIRLAELIRDQGVVRDFPWLGDFTVLGSVYADQHFLYHVFLIPFITWLPPFVGAKLATALLASGAVLAVYLLYRELGLRWRWLWMSILLVTNPFTFRMGLIKAPSLSILFLFLGMLFLVKRNVWGLLALSAVYVWTYGGFPVLVGIVGIYALVSAAASWMRGAKRRISARRRLEHLWKNEVRLVIACVGGIVIGLIFNPFFPKNVQFYWIQTVKIALVNYQSEVAVGGEWYPYDFMELVANTVFVSIAAVIAIILFFVFVRKQRTHTIALGIIAMIFFGLTLKSRRYVEYEVPLMLTFAASAITDALRGLHLRPYVLLAKEFFWRRVVLGMLVVMYLAIAVPTIIARDVATERKSFEGGQTVTTFSAAMSWLRAYHQTNHPEEPMPIVFHSDWDEFPILFYYNSNARYIAGLDPTFMYLKDPQKTKEWAEITTGSYRGDVFHALQNDFRASYVFVATDHEAMAKLIRQYPQFVLRYEDDEALIFEIHNTQ